jgi:hypothetical protein
MTSETSQSNNTKNKPVNVLDALHDVFTNNRISSRDGTHEKLITDLIHWAAAMCRQSHDETLAVLQNIEWSGDDVHFVCPMCRTTRPKHEKHCRLWKALGAK